MFLNFSLSPRKYLDQERGLLIGVVVVHHIAFLLIIPVSVGLAVDLLPLEGRESVRCPNLLLMLVISRDSKSTSADRWTSKEVFQCWPQSNWIPSTV
jgi:hypothetical protein